MKMFNKELSEHYQQGEKYNPINLYWLLYEKQRIMQLNCSAAPVLHISYTDSVAFLVQNICLFWFFSVANYLDFISFHSWVLPQQSYRLSTWTLSKLTGHILGKNSLKCRAQFKCSKHKENINGTIAACTSTEFTSASDTKFQRNIQKAYWRTKY